jgi:polygalacturonase
MMNSNISMSRRHWLALLSSTSAGSALLAANGAVEMPDTPPSGIAKTIAVRTYNIRDFGAKGDGKTLDTAALQAAIDACSRDHGGTVLVPAGVFVIGTTELKSNVTLHIAAGGTLLGSADGKAYHSAHEIPLRGDTTLGDGHVGLIFAVHAENITVEGPGTINGQGAQFRSPRRGVPPPSGRGGHRRPYHLLFYRCNNIRVRNLFLLDSAYHSIRIIESSFVWAYGLHIYNRVVGNNDGFHFISCQYVHVSDCDVQSGDDACAMFGSCRNITVANSTFSTRWAVFRFGGGNPENITISNCVIYETYGCPIKMQFGPDSRAQNILFSNLVLQDVTGPISIDYHSSRTADSSDTRATQAGYVRNIMFNCIRGRVVAKPRQLRDFPLYQHHRPGESRQCVVLNCIGDGYLENISINDMNVTFGGGGTAQEAQRTIPQIAGEYFQFGTPPAYGLFARRVNGLALSNVRFDVIHPDLRPAAVLDHVTDVTVNGLTVRGNAQAISALRFVETSDVLITAARLRSSAAAFLRVEGSSSDGIIIDGGDLSKAAVPLTFKQGALRNAVTLRT